MRVYLACLFVAFQLPVSGQFVPANIQGSVERYFSNAPREKLWLHLGKPRYLTGETLWFRVFHYNEKDHLSFPFSKVVYVEIINSDNEVVSKKKIRIDSRGGDGWIFLPTELSSGNYRIRAYTLWMRNFGEAFFFSQTFEIINPFKRLNLKKEPVEIITLEFFPEGGNLVSEFSSNIGFKAVDGYGRGIDFKGFIINEKNDTLIRFNPNRFGMGSFLLPEMHEKFRAITIREGQTTIHPFPEAKKTGYSMYTLYQNGVTQIHINSTKQLSMEVYVAAISRDKFLFIKPVNISGERGLFTISDEELNEGINQITIFSADGIPVCERLLFKYPKNNLTIDAVISSPQNFQRELVEIELNTLVEEKGIASDVSVSVYKSDLGSNIDPIDFESSMWLTNEIKGTIESPGYYFSEQSETRKIDLDYLMLTQGWRVYDYTGFIQDREFSFIPEFIDQTVKGLIVNAQTKEPIADERVYFTFPNKYTQLFITKSNSKGQILLETRDIYGSNDIQLRARSMDSINVDIQLTDPFHKFNYRTWPIFDPNTEIETILIKESANMQVENLFEKKVEARSAGDSSSFYVQPGSIYFLDEYTRFPVMEEVMREYVYGVFVRKEQGKFIFKVIDEAHNELMQDPPLVLLDGVPVFDIDVIMAIDPQNIERIEVVRSKYYYGDKSLHGIVAFYSYNADLPEFPLSEKAIKISYLGFQMSKQFYSPDYSNLELKESRIPDFRNQLYWSPQILTDEKGKAKIQFYTSDAEGKYTIQVHGLSKNGLPGSAQFTLEVHSNRKKD